MAAWVESPERSCRVSPGAVVAARSPIKRETEWVRIMAGIVHEEDPERTTPCPNSALRVRKRS
jgi:hypothetical protein